MPILRGVRRFRTEKNTVLLFSGIIADKTLTSGTKYKAFFFRFGTEKNTCFILRGGVGS